MLVIFVALFILLEGSRATPIEHDHPCEKYQCKHMEMPQSFPENNEELQKFCKPAMEYVDCEFRYIACLHDDPDVLEIGDRFISTLREVCSEDTLLHAAVVDNLKCFSKLVHDESKFCPMHDTSADRVQSLTETLSEEGLVSLSDYGNETSLLYECINMMNFFACQGMTLERECGTIAMDAYIEILQEAKPVLVMGCEDLYNLVPAIIRLRKLEEEKVHDIVEAFRKKK